jgi:hypothetical protein
MVKKENILQELQAISLSVAAISNRNVYSLPKDYFDSLVENVLALLQTSSPVISAPFTVPDGYFNNLAFAVMQKIKAGDAHEEANPISEELAQTAPLLTTVSKTEPYKIPTGYFENLTVELLQKLKAMQGQELQNLVFEELQQIAPLLNTINKANIYSVPQGYFQNLSSNITAKQWEEKSTVFEELEEIAPLLNTISKQVPYGVPQGYFENFAATITSSEGDIQSISGNSEVFGELVEIAPLLNTITKTNVYSIPQGYFENFAITAVAQSIAENIVEQSEVFLELEEIAPLLNTISKSGPYNVPDNYFSQLTVNVVEKPKAKVISISRSTKRVITWLAAASFTGIIAMSGYMFWQGYNKPATPVNFATSLSNVSDEEINNYLSSTPLPGVETIPSSVLDEQIPEPEPVIRNLSTDEIKDYLEKNSDPDEKSLSDI